MPGTKAGGKNAYITNISRHGLDFYARIGALGGKASNKGGFKRGSEAARAAGRKGGSMSRPYSIHPRPVFRAK